MDQLLFPTDPAKEHLIDEGCFIVEIFNQKTSGALSIAQARVESGSKTEPHRLRDMQEWYYILEGQGQMHIDQKTFGIRKGDVVYIPANAVQWVEQSGTDDLLFLCICKPGWTAEHYENASS
ncbi:MAG: cupin domain-containing protein [Saprospiraceae bacterium]|nr:cupin domain-containing protein [Saprospiraceae bacterium]